MELGFYFLKDDQTLYLLQIPITRFFFPEQFNASLSYKFMSLL